MAWRTQKDYKDGLPPLNNEYRPKCSVVGCNNLVRIMYYHKDGSRHYYKICSSHYVKKWRMEITLKASIKRWQRESATALLHHLSTRAKLRNIYFNINLEEFKKWIASQAVECAYCGIQVEHFRKLTIDRKESLLGYRIENLVLACKSCNLIKSNILTYKEMREIATNYNLKERYGKT